MKGFFDLKKSNFDPKNPQSCASCGLYKNCQSPKMKPYGKNKKGVLFLGDFPDTIDDKRGKQWQGRTGRLLQKTLSSLGFDLFKDGLSYNACNCITPKSEQPSPHQIYCCRKNVLKVIKKHKPRIVILLGNAALQSLIARVWKKDLGGITKWRGFYIPDRDLNAWICPTYHPSFVSQKEEKNNLNVAMTIWKQDLRRILELIEQPLPEYKKEEDSINYIAKTKDLKAIIPVLKKADILSFDYETTGLKPHRNAQKLISVGVTTEKGSWGWLNTSTRSKLFAEVMKSKVPKTAHNLQFEDSWTYFKIGVPVNNWKWCSMNAAHILDNRRGITGLKFQTFVNFGVGDYDSLVSKYLKSPAKEGANALNNIQDFIKEYGERELLKYNVLDSIFGYKLTLKQMKEINANTTK